MNKQPLGTVDQARWAHCCWACNPSVSQEP